MARLSFRLLLAAVGFALLAGAVGRVSDYPFGTCTEPGLPVRASWLEADLFRGAELSGSLMALECVVSRACMEAIRGSRPELWLDDRTMLCVLVASRGWVTEAKLGCITKGRGIIS